MAIEYTWKFHQFDTAPAEGDLSDVVKTIHWRINAADGEYTATSYGTVGLDEADPDTFTAFNDITEAWAIEVTSAKIEVDNIKENLANQIEIQKNPPIVGRAVPF